MTELGEFAEDERVIKSDIIRDVDTFNFYLANQYYEAIVCEDFEAIGEFDIELIDEVCYWLNYDGKAEKEELKAIKQIREGSIVTQNNRPFAYAVMEQNRPDVIKGFISNGNDDINLVRYLQELKNYKRLIRRRNKKEQD